MSHTPTRVTAEIEGDFVVFLIGARVNRWWNVRAWLPVFLAMPRMLRELSAKPELGLLGYEFHGTTTVQYWRSVEQLNAYAAAREATHLPAWRAFNATARRAGAAVGIWHETYLVGPGRYENVFVNMPAKGITKAGRVIEASGRRTGAAGRLSATEQAASRAEAQE